MIARSPALNATKSFSVLPEDGGTLRRLLALKNVPDHRIPFPYQLVAVEELLARKHLLCALRPGLGKTPIALMASHLIPGSTVVVCPPAIVGQWATRAAEWGHRSVATVRTWDEASTLVLREKLTIIADTMLTKLRVDRHSIGLLVVDESHRFKDGTTLRTKTLLSRTGLARRAAQVLALSGTPARNGPYDLYPLLTVIAPTIAPNKAAFTGAYCPAYQKFIGGRTVLSYDRATNVDELNRRLRETVLYRPKAADLEGQLPPLRREDLVLEVSLNQMTAQAALDAFSGANPNAQRDPAFSAARRTLGEAKANAAIPVLETLIDGGARPVIWCWHQSVAEIISNAIQCPAIHGGIGAPERASAVARFVAGEFPAIVATIAAAGTGLDGLQHGTDFGVFVERHYVPGDNEQAEGRIYGRVDKLQPCRFLVLHAADPMDHALDQTLRDKARTLTRMHG